MRRAVLIVIILFFFIFTACKRNYTPKPMGYFRIDFPKKTYKKFDSVYPYQFFYPAYASVFTEFNNISVQDYRMNLLFPEFKGTIHITYKEIDGNGDKYFEEARNLVYKHTIKADAINEKMFENPKKSVCGILYEIKGNAASQIQFVLTDSTENFLRGALYFNVHPNKDSLSPVLDFLKEDILYLIESFEWKEVKEIDSK